MDDWFTEHAPPAAPAPTPTEAWNKLGFFGKLAQLPGALWQDKKKILAGGLTPLLDAPSRAGNAVGDWIEAHAPLGMGGPEANLVRGAGDMIGGFTSPFGIAGLAAGELAGPAARAIGKLPVASEAGASTAARSVGKLLTPADIAMDAAKPAGPMEPLPMVDGQRQYAGFGPSAFDRASQQIGQHLADLDPNPPAPRSASQVVGDDFFRRTTGAPPVEPPAPGPTGRFTPEGFGQNVLTTGEPIFSDVGATPAPLELSGSTAQGDFPFAGELAPPRAINGSGESAASLEALNRQEAMRAHGESFVTYDRAGARRPLIGPDAVDYVPAKGETYGVEGPGGFRLLEDNGGRAPLPPAETSTFHGGGMDAPSELLDTPESLDTLDTHDRPPIELDAAGSTPFDELERMFRGEVSPTAEPAPAPAVDTAPNAASPIHPVQQLYDELMPKWQAAKAAGKDVPFSASGDIETFPEFYERVLGEPTNRFGAERRVMKPFDKAYAARQGTGPAGGSDALAALKELVGSEEGSVNLSGFTPERLAQAGGALNRWRFGSMLSGPMSHVRNLTQNAGNVALRDVENLIGRGLGKEGKRSGLAELVSPETLRVGRAEFDQPTVGTDKYGQQMSGVTGLPSRAMHAEDQMFQQALERSGTPAAEAEELLYNRSPQTKLGQDFVRLTNNPTARIKFPFTRVGTNIIEQNIQRTPGLGLLAQMVSKGALKTTAEKQILGTLVAAGGGAAGALADDPKHPMNPIAALLLGSYALPALMAHGAVTAMRRPEATTWSSAKAGLSNIQPMIPGLSGFNRDLSNVPSDYVASMVPNLLRDAGQLATGVDPTTLDTESGHRFLGPAIAKIPWLNTAILNAKKGAKGAAGPGLFGGAASTLFGGELSPPPANDDWFAAHAPGR